MTFYVGNLSPETTLEELLGLFRGHGDVASVSLPAERMKDGCASGAHRGYGFVVMRDRSEGRAALAALQGRELRGSTLIVRVARDHRTPRYAR